jgi:hypothetical protein
VTGLVPQLREINALVAAPRSPLFLPLTLPAASTPQPAQTAAALASHNTAMRTALKSCVSAPLYAALADRLDPSQVRTRSRAGVWKADPRRQQHDWFLKCLQGGRAHTLAACGVATICCSPPALLGTGGKGWSQERESRVGGCVYVKAQW